MVMLTVRKYLC